MPLLTLRGCLIEARNTIDQALPLAWRTGTCVLRGFSGGTTFIASYAAFVLATGAYALHHHAARG